MSLNYTQPTIHNISITLTKEAIDRAKTAMFEGEVSDQDETIYPQ